MKILLVIITLAIIFTGCVTKMQEEEKSAYAWDESSPYAEGNDKPDTIDISHLPVITDPVAIAKELGITEIEAVSDTEIRYHFHGDEGVWHYIKQLQPPPNLSLIFYKEGDKEKYFLPPIYKIVMLNDSSMQVISNVDFNGDSTATTKSVGINDNTKTAYYIRQHQDIYFISKLWLFNLKDQLIGKEIKSDDFNITHTLYIGFRTKNQRNNLPEFAEEAFLERTVYEEKDYLSTPEMKKVLKSVVGDITFYGLVVEDRHFYFNP